MKALTKILAGGVVAAGLMSAAPAAAQYYPGYGYPGYGYGNGGNVVGQVINQVLGGGYGNYGYAQPGGSQLAVNQCSAAVQQRLGGYAGYGYSPYGGYGGGGRVLGVTSVEIRSGGGYKVKGVASAGNGYGYGANIGFSCRTDYRGLVTSVDFNRNAGYGYNNYNYADPYSAYGYRRY